MQIQNTKILSVKTIYLIDVDVDGVKYPYRVETTKHGELTLVASVVHAFDKDKATKPKLRKSQAKEITKMIYQYFNNEN